MSALDQAGMVIKVVCALVLSVGMLAGLPGTASALPPSGFADFCDPATYDNTLLYNGAGAAVAEHVHAPAEAHAHTD